MSETKTEIYSWPPGKQTEKKNKQDQNKKGNEDTPMTPKKGNKQRKKGKNTPEETTQTMQLDGERKGGQNKHRKKDENTPEDTVRQMPVDTGRDNRQNKQTQNNKTRKMQLDTEERNPIGNTEGTQIPKKQHKGDQTLIAEEHVQINHQKFMIKNRGGGRYLGFMIHLGGNNKMTKEKILETWKQRIGMISKFGGLSIAEKALIANSFILQAPAYHVCLDKLPVTKLRQVTSSIRQEVKKGNVARNFPPDLIHMPKDWGAWGLKDLEIEEMVLTLQLWMDVLNQAKWSYPYMHKIAWSYLRQVGKEGKHLVVTERYNEFTITAKTGNHMDHTMGAKLANILQKLDWDIRGWDKQEREWING